MFVIAGGILLAILAIRVGIGIIDWLDWRTSQITEAEARRRAKLTMEGKWPPVVRFITGRQFTVALIGLSLLWLLAIGLHRY